jgi:hypothetical protein
MYIHTHHPKSLTFGENRQTILLSPLFPSVSPPTMAPSTPTKSHHKIKKRRGAILAADRQKRQDSKSTPKREKKPHLIATITQDTGGPSDASSLTTPSATSPPFSSPATSATPNAGVDALVHKKGSISKTKPVAITATNVLSWFRDNSDAPLSGNSETIRRSARHLFSTVPYLCHDNDNNTCNRRDGSTASSNNDASPYIAIHGNIPVGGISPIRRLLLEDIALLPANTGLLCVFCVGSGHTSFDFYRDLWDTLMESERLPIRYCDSITFIQFKVSIVNNPHRTRFETGSVISRKLFTNLVIGNGNASIGVEFSGTQDGIHTAFLLFSDFFIHHSVFQMWACLSFPPQLPRSLQVKEQQRKSTAPSPSVVP